MCRRISRWVLSIALVVSASAAVAATPVATCDLAKVQQAYQGVAGFQAQFTQESTLAALDRAERSSGTVWFERPGKMRWSYAEPERQEFLIREEKGKFFMSLYQPALRQILKQRLESVLISELPVGFLMGLGDLEKSFKLEKTESLPLKAERFILVPRRGEEKGLSRLILEVDARGLPQAAEIVDVAENRTTIRFHDLAVNSHIPAVTFELNVPAGTDVLDETSGAESL